MENRKEVYFDNSATTRVFDSVRDVMVEAMTSDYGNTSSRHMKGVEAERYIRENYPDSGLSVERLCGHLHISQSYFSNIFKQETGRSYVQYLTDVRMEHAVELLRTTDDKTYLVAEKVGYDEPNYFSYVFKKRFGISPSQFRK